MAEVIGRLAWGMTRNRQQIRNYMLKLLVKASDYDDGPQQIMNASGMPLIGSPWLYGNDADLFAYCTPDLRITPRVKNKPKNMYYEADLVFSNAPFTRCQDTSWDDPLDEPMRISGSFIKYTEEATKDRHGNAIKNKAHEMFRGPQNEWDANRPTVVIEQNVADLELDIFSAMVDTVNDGEMWGLDARKIKLSNAPWERLVYGSCGYYYKRRFEFDIKFDGFDRELYNEGTKVRRGLWLPDVLVSPVTYAWVPDATADPANPLHFQRWKDRNGENCRVPLDENGDPDEDGSDPVYISVEKYEESDFFELGIPANL